MKTLIISFVLIFSYSFTYSQTNKKIDLESKAIGIISKLKEVQELEVSAKKNNTKVIYITDNQTKKVVEISVAVDMTERVIRSFFYKYYSDGRLFKLDMSTNEYKLVQHVEIK